MKSHLITLLAALSFACSSTPPAKAPGTEPGDMTAEGHEAEAAKHNQEADEHKAMQGQKPGSEEKAEHLGEAQEHRDVAGQHQDAADAVKKQEQK